MIKRRFVLHHRLLAILTTGAVAALVVSPVAGQDLVSMILCVSACMSPRFMKPTTTALQPTEGKAVVRFLFPRTGGYNWDGETFLGTGYPSAQFDYHASPGKHIFFTTAENKAF